MSSNGSAPKKELVKYGGSKFKIGIKNNQYYKNNNR